MLSSLAHRKSRARMQSALFGGLCRPLASRKSITKLRSLRRANENSIGKRSVHSEPFVTLCHFACLFWSVLASGSSPIGPFRTTTTIFALLFFAAVQKIRSERTIFIALQWHGVKLTNCRVPYSSIFSLGADRKSPYVTFSLENIMIYIFFHLNKLNMNILWTAGQLRQPLIPQKLFSTSTKQNGTIQTQCIFRFGVWLTELFAFYESVEAKAVPTPEEQRATMDANLQKSTDAVNFAIVANLLCTVAKLGAFVYTGA